MALRRIDIHYFNDSAGRSYIVDEYQHVTTVGAMTQSTREIALKKSLKLLDGRPVNYIDDDTFEIVEGSVRITRQ